MSSRHGSRALLISASCLSVLIPASSCSYIDELTSRYQDAGAGNFRLLVTDAPANPDELREAWLTVEQVTVRNMNGEFFRILHEPLAVDLLKLRNGITAVLSKASLPAGHYDQLRLYISQASVRTGSGELSPVHVPSGARSGLKLNIVPSIEVFSQLSQDVIIDVDVSRSFIRTESSGTQSARYKLMPVLRASNQTLSGSVEGIVMSDAGTSWDQSDDQPLEQARVTLRQDGEIVATAMTEAGGYYRIIGVTHGQDYHLSFEAADHGWDSSRLFDVVAGNLARVDSILPVQPQE